MKGSFFVKGDQHECISNNRSYGKDNIERGKRYQLIVQISS